MNHGEGHYSVKVDVDGQEIVHQVYAKSDYAAALKVRAVTGCMPRSERDVTPCEDIADRFHYPVSGGFTIN